MLKRPSSRRKSHTEGIELNLVPILDTMVTLIGFLLFTTSFLAIVSIDTDLPRASSLEVQQKMNEKPLQLTLNLEEKEARIWSPFNKIEAKSIPNLQNGQTDVKAVHDALIDIKKKFLEEKNIVLAPSRGVSYDTLIAVMDNVRVVESTDPPIYEKNEKTGLEEPVKTLFPNVVFGNLLEED